MLLAATVGNSELLHLLVMEDTTVRILLHLIPNLQILHFLLSVGHDIFNDFNSPIQAPPVCLKSLRVLHCHCGKRAGATLKSILAFFYCPPYVKSSCTSMFARL